MKRKNILHLKSGVFLLLLTLAGCVKVLDPLPTDKVLLDQLLNKRSSGGAVLLIQSIVINFRIFWS